MGKDDAAPEKEEADKLFHLFTFQLHSQVLSWVWVTCRPLSQLKRRRPSRKRLQRLANAQKCVRDEGRFSQDAHGSCFLHFLDFPTLDYLLWRTIQGQAARLALKLKLLALLDFEVPGWRDLLDLEKEGSWVVWYMDNPHTALPQSEQAREHNNQNNHKHHEQARPEGGSILFAVVQRMWLLQAVRDSGRV